MDADRDFDRTTAEKGLEGWVSFFADDGVQFPLKQPVIRGHDAIRKEMASLFADTSLSLRWEPAEARIAASGDLGFTIGHATVYRTENGQRTPVKRLKYLTVWKRVAGGAWRVAADIGNEE